MYWYQRGKRIASPWHPETYRRQVSVAVQAYSNVQAQGNKPLAVTEVSQVMSTSVQSLRPDSTLLEAQKFLQQFRFRHIPVVDDAGLLRGIVSDRDLLRASVAGGRTFLDWMNQNAGVSPSLSEFMTERVLTALPGTGIREVANALCIERIGCMPVLDAAGRLLGIVTRSDILRLLVRQAPSEFWI